MRPLNLEIKGGYAFGSAKFEWRGVAAPERDPQPARGEEWVLPPQPRRTPRTPATRITSTKSRSRSGGANCKKDGKSCAFASPSKDAITSRGVSLPPLKTPSRYVPPRRAMRRLGASALLQALPRAQSLALRRRKFCWKPWSTRLHTPGFRVCLMAPKPTSFGMFCTGHSFAGTRRRQCRPFSSLRFSTLDGSLPR